MAWLKPEINFGHILVAVSMLVASVRSVSLDHGSIVSVSDKVTEIQQRMETSFDKLDKSIAALPNVQASQLQMEKRQDQADKRQDQANVMIGGIQRATDRAGDLLASLNGTVERIAPIVDRLDRESKVPLGILPGHR
jgi:TolA-binding protein